MPITFERSSQYTASP